MDIRNVMEELGHRLVNDYQFRRAELYGKSHLNQSTEPVARFLIWLEGTPEAQQVLESMGVLQLEKSEKNQSGKLILSGKLV